MRPAWAIWMAGHRALLLEKRGDARQRRDVLIRPQTEAARSDAALRRHRRGLNNHQAGAAHRARPQMRKCQSLATPSVAEYWHIGETPMRLRNVTERTVSGENK